MNKILIVSLIVFAVVMISQAHAEVNITSQIAELTNYTGEDIQPYTGYIGPDSPLYELKIIVENIDEQLTFNKTAKIEKKLKHAKTRISEAKRELLKNRNETASKAMSKYAQKSQDIENEIRINGDKIVGLENARIQIMKHQLVLQILSKQNPDNVGIQKALYNTGVLQIKFEDKIMDDYKSQTITELRCGDTVNDCPPNFVCNDLKYTTYKWNNTNQDFDTNFSIHSKCVKIM